MFRKMTRHKQLLSKEEYEKILYKVKSGVLSVEGDNNYLYAVPMSYLYEDNKIYFHSVNSGYKIDSIKKMKKFLFVLQTKMKFYQKNIQYILELLLFFSIDYRIRNSQKKYY